jgi:phage-related minor tail protein
MAKKNIGAYITLDGEKEFRTATSACNKSVGTLRSEMKLVEAQTEGNANTLDALKKKHDVLSRTLDEHVKKEETIKKGLKNSEEQYEKVGNKLAEYKSKLQQAKSALEELEKSSDTTEEALKEQQEQVEGLEKIVSKGEETYQRAGNRVNDWKKQLNNAEAQTIRATKALNENDTYLKEAEKSWDRCAKSIDEFGNKADDTVEKLTEIRTILKANITNTAVEIGKDAFTSAIQGTLELEEAQNRLQASTGATAEETKAYKEEMQEVYSAGYGDSIRDVADTMALVKQYTNETDPSKLKEMTESAMALDETFGIDLSDSIRGADALMDNMGLTAEQAFDYIAKGAQNGLDKSGELTDNLAEYSQLWGQAGFSAEEMFSILQNGLDSGAYNLDKVNDFVKEFGNSLADGRIEKNINSFSGNTKILFEQWKNGEASTKQVFQSVISDLANMENKQQALTIASNTWSALGEDNAMKVITSLNKANNAYKDVSGTMQEIKSIQYDSVAKQWKTLGRTFQIDVMTPMLEKFLPTAKKGMEVLKDNIGAVTVLAKAAAPVIAGMFVVKKGNELVKLLDDTQKGIKGGIKWLGAHTVAKTAATAAENASTAATTANTAATGTAATTANTAATGAATAAQGAFNAVLSANPIALVVLGIAATTTAVAALSSGLREAKEETSELAKEADKNIEKLKETSNALEETTDSAKDSVQTVEAQKKVADGLIAKLYSLESQTGKTKGEIAQMNAITSRLNTMFPELSLSVDENTGELNRNEEQVRRSADAALELAKASAVQEKMIEISEKLVDADIARYEAEQNLADIDNELKKLEQDRQNLLNGNYETVEKGTEKQIKFNGELTDYYTALSDVSEAEAELKERQKEQTEALGELNEKCNEVNDKYQSAYEYMQKNTEEAERNTQATDDNTAAKQANADAETEKQEASKASIEQAGEELAAYQGLSAAQQQLATDVTNSVLTMQESVQSALSSQMDMFEAFDGGVEISTQQLLSNMQSQVDGVTQWEQNLSTLANKGINEGILQKLAEMGPQGSGYVAAFASMTDEELAKANELWSQSVDIKGMTDQWGQQLLESGAANIAGGMENLAPIMQQSGANTVAGLVKGMQDAQAAAEAQGHDLGVKVIESVNNGLDVRSPSAKTTRSGIYVDQGLANGMNLGKATVMIASTGVAMTIINQLNSMLTVTQFANIGTRIPEGLALGIQQGKSQVIYAITEATGAAIRAANEKLEIHSPSHVFRRMGNNTMDSYGMGVKDRAESVKSSVMESLNFSDINGKIDTKAGRAGIKEQNIFRDTILEGMSKMKLVAYIGNREVTRTLSDLGVMFHARV